MIKQLTLEQLQSTARRQPGHHAAGSAAGKVLTRTATCRKPLHMPHDQTRQLAPILVPDTSTEVVVYCASATCQNSHIAARVLDQIGYRNVSVFAGGKQAWIEAGLALEPGLQVAA